MITNDRASWLRRLKPLLSSGRNDGPPDLDELWRDLNRRLSGLFSGHSGGTGSGHDGGPPPGSGRGPGIGMGLIAGVTALIWLSSGFFIVQEGEQGVVLSFGRYSHTGEAGFQWRMPYPFQSHEIVSMTQLRTAEVGRNEVVQATGLRDSSMLTQDENIVDIRFTVQYRLNNAQAYLFENHRPEEAVIHAAESAVREIVGRSKMDSVLYEQRDAIAIDLMKSVQAQIDRLKTGITVVNVNVQGVQPPEQVQAAFDDAVRAGADRERFKNEGQAYANDIVPRAQGAASRLKEEAAGYADRVVAAAEGDAERFRRVWTEYQKAPAVTRDRLYLETMQSIYTNVTKVLVDSRAGSNLLYLPLDKLIQTGPPVSAAGAASSTPGGGSTAGGSETVMPLPVPPVDTRSRESQRTRDRDVR